MIEKILERILLASSSCKAYKLVNPSKEDVAEMNAYKKCYEIVQEVAKEYGNGWIPTAEMLFPRYGQKVLASVRTDIATHEVIITEYQRQEYWHNGIITAWCELPTPYQKGE